MILDGLPKINEKATRGKVKALLEQYDSIKRLAGGQYEQNLTTNYSLERIRTGKIHNPTEHTVTKNVSAAQILEKIYAALNELDSNERKILWNHYVLKMTNGYFIEETYNFSVSTYYNHLKKSQISFAEVFGAGELLVVDDD